MEREVKRAQKELRVAKGEVEDAWKRIAVM